MNENNLGELQKYHPIKAFTILSGSAGFPGGYYLPARIFFVFSRFLPAERIKWTAGIE